MQYVLRHSLLYCFTGWVLILWMTWAHSWSCWHHSFPSSSLSLCVGQVSQRCISWVATRPWMHTHAQHENPHNHIQTYTYKHTYTHTHNMDPHLLVFSNYSYTHFPPIPDVAGIHPIVVVVNCRNSRWSHKGCFSPAPSKERQHGRRGSKGQQSGMTERQNVVSLLHILDSV